jgi:chromosome segregation ATPase
LGKKIPHAIKDRVLRGWLRGLSRDSIAIENKIGYGSVSSIIDQFRIQIPDIDLLRAVSAELMKNGLDLYQLGASIRLKGKLDKITLPVEKIEYILEQINIHCFQEGIETEQFFVHIDEVTQMANNLDISIYDIAESIERAKQEMARLDEQISTKTIDISRLIVEEGITRKDLEEYRMSRPLGDRIRQLEWKLEEKDEIIINLQKDISKLRSRSDRPKDQIVVGLRKPYLD